MPRLTRRAGLGTFVQLVQTPRNRAKLATLWPPRKLLNASRALLVFTAMLKR